MRVIVADDSALIRDGLRALLSEADFDVVAGAADAEELLRKVASHEPDLVVVDVRMPPTHTDEGIRAAREIRSRFPTTGVVVLTQYAESAYAVDLLSEGAEGLGYLLKDRVTDIASFADALRRVGSGGSALDPEVVAGLVGARKEGPLDRLTPREREVLGLMAEGRSNSGIAGELVITERAVEKHVGNIFGKLGIRPAQSDHRRVLAVLTLLRG
ncbi:MAG: response regulator transcription factor [Miltoncostaeaceae bacterium]